MGVVFLASVVIGVNRFKPPPVLPTLMDELQIDMVTGGWLMSVSAVAAIILSIPAALFMNRIGLKLTGLLALGCVALGSIVGALATDAPQLLVDGVIEGIGATLISVVAPAAISLWFPLEERGLPMGIWAGWIPVGNVIMFNIAHPLADTLGWRSIWWFGAGISFVAMLLFALVVTTPSKEKPRGPKGAPTSGALLRGLSNPLAWLLGLSFGAFSFGLLGYNSWSPTFLTETLEISPSAASSLASLMFLAAIPANIVAGWFINRIKNPSKLLPVPFLLMGLLFLWGFRLESREIVAPYMITLGFISNFIPATIFTLAPETAPDPASTSLALGIVNVGSNIGAIAGPPALGAIVNSGNWRAGGVGLVLVMIVGALVSWIASNRREHDRSR